MLLYFANSKRRYTSHFGIVPRARRNLRHGSKPVVSFMPAGMSLPFQEGCNLAFAGSRLATCKRLRQPFDTWSYGHSTSEPNTRETSSRDYSSGRHFQPAFSSDLTLHESVFVLGERHTVPHSLPCMITTQQT